PSPSPSSGSLLVASTSTKPAGPAAARQTSMSMSLRAMVNRPHYQLPPEAGSQWAEQRTSVGRTAQSMTFDDAPDAEDPDGVGRASQAHDFDKPAGGRRVNYR